METASANALGQESASWVCRTARRLACLELCGKRVVSVEEDVSAEGAEDQLILNLARTLHLILRIRRSREF